LAAFLPPASRVREAAAARRSRSDLAQQRGVGSAPRRIVTRAFSDQHDPKLIQAIRRQRVGDIGSPSTRLAAITKQPDEVRRRKPKKIVGPNMT